MKAKIFYCIGSFDDEIIVEGDTIDELREKCDAEISRRGAVYTGSKILES